MSVPLSDPRNATAGADAQPPEAAGAAAAARSPRTVIRGERSDEEAPRGDGKGFGAFTDFLNVTFRLPEWKDPAAGFFYRLCETVGSSFGVMEDQGRGLHGYLRSFGFERGGARFAYGGQFGTGFLSIPGDGCALVPDWGRLVGLLHGELGARITRWDGAVDDFEGAYPVDRAVELYLSGAFNAGGRKPSCDQKGNWIEPDGSGRTFYVGKRQNGKLLRVYEKGKQLGETSSPWVRWEVELHNVDRVIPWTVIADPAPHIAGAYPALSWVNELASRIPTLRRTDQISYERIIFYARVAYGRLIDTMLEREGSSERVVDRLWREGTPRRLETTRYLGMGGESAVGKETL
jgi:phage replication initiation protein